VAAAEDISVSLQILVSPPFVSVFCILRLTVLSVRPIQFWEVEGVLLGGSLGRRPIFSLFVRPLAEGGYLLSGLGPLASVVVPVFRPKKPSGL
jgi:hypothetical protein